MSFFNQFPKIKYDLRGNSLLTNVIDIFRNVDVNDILADTNNSYLFYDIPDGDRPDIVSRKLYDDPRYYWTFFIINDHLKNGVLDSWPKSSGELERFLADQYDAYSVIELFPTTTLTTSGITELGVTTIALTAAPSPVLTAGTFIYGSGIAAKTTSTNAAVFVSISGTTITINPATTAQIVNGTFLTSALSPVNGIDLSYENLRVSVKSLIDDEAAGGSYAPRWKIFKYDSNRYQLWIDAPDSYSNFIKLANTANDYLVLTLVNEVVGTSPEAIAARAAVTAKNNAWLGVNSSGTELGSGFLLWAKTNASTAVYNSVKNAIGTIPDTMYKCMRVVEFKASNTWFVGRDAPIAFKDSDGNNVTTHRRRTNTSIGLTTEISYADYEIGLNDDKRKIRVLPVRLIRQFSEEYEKKLNE